MDIRGIRASALSDDDLLRELSSLHRSRHNVLGHGSALALAEHTRRSLELESEYLVRYRPTISRARQGALAGIRPTAALA